MTRKIKAIETVYNGYRFRSRLEARWAVFFDTLGFSYYYEMEGLNLGNGEYYLPDFYLPSLRLYLEIKPCLTDLDDWPSHPLLEDPSQEIKFALLMGNPWVNPVDIEEHEIEGKALYMVLSDEAFEYNVFVPGDCYYRWCECPDCGMIGLAFSGRSDRLSCKCCYFCALVFYHSHQGTKGWLRRRCQLHGQEYSNIGCKRYGGNFDKGYNSGTPRLMEAYTAARQARFEHGWVGIANEKSHSV